MFKNASTGNYGINTVTPSNKLDIYGTIAVNSAATINFIEIATPIILNVSYSGTVTSLQALPSGIPSNASTLLAEVYYSASSADHQTFTFSPTAQSLKTWVDSARGAQPSTNFSSFTSYRTSTVVYPGENDSFSSFYGLWRSVIIPVSSSGFYINNYGNSGSNGYVYFVIRGYSLNN